MIFEAGEMMEPNVPAAAVVGVVARKTVEQRIEADFENVARAAGIDSEASAVWRTRSTPPPRN